jgi:hypothetical protein
MPRLLRASEAPSRSGGPLERIIEAIIAAIIAATSHTFASFDSPRRMFNHLLL